MVYEGDVLSAMKKVNDWCYGKLLCCLSYGNICIIYHGKWVMLAVSSRIEYQGISDTANQSIVLNAHSRHICGQLLSVQICF